MTVASNENLATVAASARPAAPRRQRGALWAWVVFIIGALYFIVPLIATFEVSMRSIPLFSAYTNAFASWAGRNI